MKLVEAHKLKKKIDRAIENTDIPVSKVDYLVNKCYDSMKSVAAYLKK